MSSGIFYRWVSINIWQQSKAKSIVIIIGRVGESVNNDAMILRMVNLQHSKHFTKYKRLGDVFGFWF